jgi:hypothetical protein
MFDGTIKEYPSQAELSERYKYLPDTGEIIGILPGKTFGKPCGHAGQFHRRIGIGSEKFLAHRIAWILFHGHLPPQTIIDHLNGNGLDNRMKNLRIASYSDNSRNTRQYRINRWGYPGVESKNGKTFKASVQIDKKTARLPGTYKTPKEAHAVGVRYREENGYTDRHLDIDHLVSV